MMARIGPTCRRPPARGPAQEEWPEAGRIRRKGRNVDFVSAIEDAWLSIRVQGGEMGHAPPRRFQVAMLGPARGDEQAQARSVLRSKRLAAAAAAAAGASTATAAASTTAAAA